jgi:hypothetical protein
MRIWRLRFDSTVRRILGTDPGRTSSRASRANGMGNRLFKLGHGLLLAVCAVVVNSASGAYLPHLGPSPLRFESQSPFVATMAMFPALRLDDSASPTNAGSMNSATNLPPAEDGEPLGPPRPAESTAVDATSSIARVASIQPPVVIDGTLRVTPQMLVDFFKPMQNGTNATTVASPGGSFTPPQLLPSSSATYRSN